MQNTLVHIYPIHKGSLWAILNRTVVTVYGWMGYPCDWLKETLDSCRVKDYTSIIFYQKHGRD